MRQGLQAAAHQVSMEVKQVRGGLCSLAAGCSAAGRHVARALVHHRAKTPRSRNGCTQCRTGGKQPIGVYPRPVHTCHAALRRCCRRSPACGLIVFNCRVSSGFQCHPTDGRAMVNKVSRCSRAAQEFRPHACLFAAQNSAACAKLSPGLMPFWTSSSLPPLPTTTWLRRKEGGRQAVQSVRAQLQSGTRSSKCKQPTHGAARCPPSIGSQGGHEGRASDLRADLATHPVTCAKWTWPL